MRIHALSLALLATALHGAEDYQADQYGDAGAADDDVHPLGVRHPFYFGGVRLAGGVTPGVKTQEVSGTKTTLTPKYGGDGRFGVFWDTSMDGGFGLAVDSTVFFSESWGSTGSGPTFLRHQLKSWGLRIGIGPALTLGPVTLELMPFGALGSAEDRVEAGTSYRDHSGAAPILDYGATLNAFYLFESNMYFGGYAGYQAFTTTVKYPQNPTKVTLSGDGLTAGVMLGLWF
jgi:hypothetical protein